MSKRDAPYPRFDSEMVFDLTPDYIGGGDEPPGGPMEARVAKLESAAEFIQRDISELKTDIKQMRGDITSIRTTDFRMLFGAIIAVALGLAGLMAKGFSWL